MHRLHQPCDGNSAEDIMHCSEPSHNPWFTVGNLRITADILWRVFRILTEPDPYKFVYVNRQNNEVQARTAMWARTSLFRRFMDTNVYATDYVKQQAFETCWAHSPLRAAARSNFTLPFTRCRYCRTLPAHRCSRQRQRQCVTAGTAMAP